MATYQLLLDGVPVDNAVYDTLSTLEIEENADLPDAVRLVVPLNTADQDLTWVGDPKVRPFAAVAVLVSGEDNTGQQCLFDGYVLSHKAHVQTGVTDSTLEVWGQDASVLMGLEDKIREWSGMTDGQVANAIFAEYQLTCAPENTVDDSPAHTEQGRTLMQRGSDIAFLRRLARRTGRWCRVVAGAAVGQRTGFFAVPSLSGDPVVTINPNDPVKAAVSALDFTWDVSRPTQVAARQASLTDTDPQGVSADTADSGLPPLDARGLAEFAGRATQVMLTAATDTAELPGRARGVLREAGWFARCAGSADRASLRSVLRVGAVVAVEGVGQLLSGRYVVERVRHSITAESHAMSFTLARNAVGPPSAGLAAASGNSGTPAGPS